ncbi:hypothetical protein ZWY2020_000035 [Hordeum vulgare]|nr:hypothetical protein ZWY2020_000035 [Hordeum vulgare]
MVSVGRSRSRRKGEGGGPFEWDAARSGEYSADHHDMRPSKGEMTTEALGGAVSGATDGALSLSLGGQTGDSSPAASKDGRSVLLGGKAVLAKMGGEDSRRTGRCRRHLLEACARSGTIKLHRYLAGSPFAKITIFMSRYFQDEEYPKIGHTMEIDGFSLIVKDFLEGHQGDLRISKDVKNVNKSRSVHDLKNVNGSDGGLKPVNDSAARCVDLTNSQDDGPALASDDKS